MVPGGLPIQVGQDGVGLGLGRFSWGLFEKTNLPLNYRVLSSTEFSGAGINWLFSGKLLLKGGFFQKVRFFFQISKINYSKSLSSNSHHNSNFQLRIVIQSNLFWRFEKRIPLSEKPHLQSSPSTLGTVCVIKKCSCAGPSEGLKIRGRQYYLEGIICPPWLRQG